MKKILFILMPSGYQDAEFSVPYTALKKKKCTIDVAGFQPGEAVGAQGYKFIPNIQLDDLADDALATYDAVVIPGGPNSPDYLWFNNQVQTIVRTFHEAEKLVATICYASVVPAQAGILEDKEATVYPTEETKNLFEKHGVAFSESGVVVLEKENIITAQGPQYAEEFVQAIINHLNL